MSEGQGQVSRFLTKLGRYWTDTLEVDTLFQLIESGSVHDLMVKGNFFIKMCNTLRTDFNFDDTNADEIQNWSQIYRPSISYPWQGEITAQLEENLLTQGGDTQNKQNGHVRASMRYQIEIDLLTTYLRCKITVALLSIFAIMQLYIQSATTLTAFECLLSMITPIGIVQTIKLHQIQLTVYLLQFEMIIIAWLLFYKTGSQALDQTQVQLSLYVFLFVWANTYLKFQSRSSQLAMKLFKVKYSTVLGHIMYLLIVLILFQLQTQFVSLFLIGCAVQLIRDFLHTSQIVKLVDRTIETQDQMKQNNHFIAGIVHDLRGPVSCIKMFLETLEIQLPQQVLTETLKRSIRSCLRSSAHVFQMVSNILDLSKLKEKKFEIVQRPENLEQLVKDAVDLHQTKIEQKGIHIKVFRQPQYDFPSHLQLDGCRISQILINLISNAVKFTSSGDIKVVLKWRPKTSTSSSTSIMVEQHPWYTTDRTYVNDISNEDSQLLSVGPASEEEQKQYTESESNFSMSKGSETSKKLSPPISMVEESKFQPQKERPSFQIDAKMSGRSYASGFSDLSQEIKQQNQSCYSYSEIDTPAPRLSSVMDIQEDDFQVSGVSQYSLASLANLLQPALRPKVEEYVLPQQQLERVLEIASESEADSKEESEINECDFEELETGQDDKISLVTRSVVPAEKTDEPNYKYIRQNSVPLSDSQRRVFIEISDYDQDDKPQSQPPKQDTVQRSPCAKVDAKKEEEEVGPIPQREIQEIDAQILRVEIVGTMGETGSNMEIYSMENSGGNDPNFQSLDVKPQNLPAFNASEISIADRYKSGDDSMVSMLDYLQENQPESSGMHRQPIIAVAESISRQISQASQQASQAVSSSLFGKYNFNRQTAEEPSRLPQSQVRAPSVDGIQDALEMKNSSKKLQSVLESSSDALQRFRQDTLGNRINLPRRQSVSSQNSQDDNFTPKTIKVRHPLRARSKSITLPNFQSMESKSFPISRLNNYDPTLKKHRGSIVSMQSSLQSIEEDDDQSDRKPDNWKSSSQDKQSKQNNVSKNSSSFRKKVLCLDQVSRPNSELQSQRQPIQINNIMNFGHGRRNNLVKVAEEISQRERAKSVCIINQDLHMKRFQAQCDIQKPEPIPSFPNNNEALNVSSSKKGKEDQQFLNNSFQESQQEEDSQDNQPKKSVFALAYSFTAEVARANERAQVQPPIQRGRSRGAMPPPKMKTHQTLMSSITSNITFDGNKVSTNSISRPSELEDWEDGILTIEVIDNGIGISLEEQSRLFMPFNQVNVAVGQEFGGTGLGLWISRQMSHLMKGDLTLFSAGKGLGSTFTFTVPTQTRIRLNNQKTAEFYSNIPKGTPSPISSSVSEISQPTPKRTKFHKVMVISDDVTVQVLASQFRLYNKVTQVLKLKSITSLQQFEQEPETTHMIFFDCNAQVNFLEELVKIKARRQLTKGQVLLIQMKYSVEDTRNPVEGLAKSIDFNVLKLNMQSEIKQIVDFVYGEDCLMRKAHTTKHSHSEAGLMSQSHYKPPDFEIKEEPPSFSDLKTKEPVRRTSSKQLQQKPLNSRRAPTKAAHSSRDVLFYQIKRSHAFLENKVNDVLKTQEQFTPVGKVPNRSSVIIIVDDDEFVRTSTQQSLMHHSKQYLLTYTKKNKPEAEILKKIVTLSTYMVEAKSGEESILMFRALVEKECKVHLILMDINMGNLKIKGYEAAKQIRHLELSIKDNEYKPVVIIGHSGNDAESLFKNKKVCNYMNGCKDKPLDLITTRKLVSALNSGTQSSQSRRDKILKAFVKEDGPQVY